MKLDAVGGLGDIGQIKMKPCFSNYPNITPISKTASGKATLVPGILSAE